MLFYPAVTSGDPIGLFGESMLSVPKFWHHFLCNRWIGLRENLQETMLYTIKYRGFL